MSYYSSADWSKLSFEVCDRICKDHDKQGEQGRMKQGVSQVSVETNNTSNKMTPNTQAGNSFGGKQRAAKKAKGPCE
jgi:hypothetical protein